ncbi:hypothetical protein LJR255_001580 [Pararhizobium sp. LjRoot255]|uniref:hypothetical protein n=1 Tax=Pararhizobium sp. LjRoot255 TaxID=3342298 RepID=UPI003ED12882
MEQGFRFSGFRFSVKEKHLQHYPRGCGNGLDKFAHGSSMVEPACGGEWKNPTLRQQRLFRQELKLREQFFPEPHFP